MDNGHGGEAQIHDGTEALRAKEAVNRDGAHLCGQWSPTLGKGGMQQETAPSPAQGRGLGGSFARTTD